MAVPSRAAPPRTPRGARARPAPRRTTPRAAAAGRHGGAAFGVGQHAREHLGQAVHVARVDVLGRVAADLGQRARARGGHRAAARSSPPGRGSRSLRPWTRPRSSAASSISVDLLLVAQVGHEAHAPVERRQRQRAPARGLDAHAGQHQAPGHEVVHADEGAQQRRPGSSPGPAGRCTRWSAPFRWRRALRAGARASRAGSRGCGRRPAGSARPARRVVLEEGTISRRARRSAARKHAAVEMALARVVIGELQRRQVVHRDHRGAPDSGASSALSAISSRWRSRQRQPFRVHAAPEVAAAAAVGDIAPLTHSTCARFGRDSPGQPLARGLVEDDAEPLALVEGAQRPSGAGRRRRRCRRRAAAMLVAFRSEVHFTRPAAPRVRPLRGRRRRPRPGRPSIDDAPLVEPDQAVALAPQELEVVGDEAPSCSPPAMSRGCAPGTCCMKNSSPTPKTSSTSSTSGSTSVASAKASRAYMPEE